MTSIRILRNVYLFYEKSVSEAKASMVSPGATLPSEERCREPSCVFLAGENDSVFSRELNKLFLSKASFAATLIAIYNFHYASRSPNR